MDEKKEVQMPIDKMSYTDMTQLLRNPLIFKLKKMLGVYDSKPGISAMVGRAGHEALKFYYGGNKDIPVPTDRDEARAQAFDIGLKYLAEYQDAYIKYGKRGSREKMLKTYTQAMHFYWSEEPTYRNILICEERLEAEIRTMDGQQLPIPAVGIPDLVDETEPGIVDIIDTKFTSKFTEYEDADGEPYEDWIKIIQAMFLYHLLRESRGISARQVVFREIKTTENTKENAGKPQIRDYVIPCDHEPYKIIFYNLYRDVVNFLKNPNAIYLPNLSDPFDGEQAGLLYAQGLISADMSDVEVMHKVADVAIVSKKFITSRLEKIEYAHLPPEERIKVRLGEFGIPVRPEETQHGASITQYRFKVSAGVSMNVFEKHKADIALALEAKGPIRIQAPIPGTSLVGIEVENEVRTSSKIQASMFRKGTLSVPIGKNLQDETIYLDIQKAPHTLIAGATGSGKSVLLHNILHGVTKQMTPDQLKLILIDPKRVELTSYAKVEHLDGSKVIYERDGAIRALLALVDTMEERYEKLEEAGVRDIDEYNEAYHSGTKDRHLRFILVVIDEFADLIIQARSKKARKISYSSKGKDWLWSTYNRRKRDEARAAGKKVDAKFSAIAPIQNWTRDRLIDALESLDAENDINREDADMEMLMVRLAQMGRAVGIHLIIATQRPSVDVITGLIKANFPTRIALTTSSATDSEVILGERGAEKLAGRGDMLFMAPGLTGGKQRIQGFELSSTKK